MCKWSTLVISGGCAQQQQDSGSFAPLVLADYTDTNELIIKALSLTFVGQLGLGEKTIVDGTTEKHITSRARVDGGRGSDDSGQSGDDSEDGELHFYDWSFGKLVLECD